MTKFKLSLDKIKEFINLASKIDTQKNLELLSTAEYIKVEIIMGECFLTKHNYKNFINYTFSCQEEDDLEILINESILFNFCESLSSKYLYIQFNETKTDLTKETYLTIKLSDNEKMKGHQSFKYPTNSIKIENFPLINTNKDGEKTRIMEDVINSISIAKNYVGLDSIMQQFTFIYLTTNKDGFGIVYTSDTQSFYSKKFSQKLNNIAISLEEVKVISGQNFIDYSSTETHNLYFKKNLIYGFRKSDNANGFDYEKFSEEIKDFIKIKLDNLILFCIRVKSLQNSKKNEYLYSNSRVIEGEGFGELEFSYIDTDNLVENINQFEILNKEGKFDGFALNHTFWFDRLKNLPYNEIIINNTSHGFLGLTTQEDKNFYGILSKIVN